MMAPRTSIFPTPMLPAGRSVPRLDLSALLVAAAGYVGRRAKPTMAVILAIGLAFAIVTDGSVPELVTKGVLAAMTVPTVVTALWLSERPIAVVRDDLDEIGG